MKSHLQQAQEQISQGHFAYLKNNVQSNDDVTSALIDLLDLTPVKISTGWHGDSFKKNKTYLLTTEELSIVEKQIAKLNNK